MTTTMLTVPQAAEALGTSTRNVRRMIAAGQVPSIKTSPRRLYIPARAVEEELEARQLAADIAYAIRHGEPAQREFSATCSSETVLRRAIAMAWRGQYDYAEDERGRGVTGWDVWGWTVDTPENEQDWRLFVRQT